MIVARLLVAACFAVLAAGASGAELGYWACAGGEWVAVGTPSYDRPLRDCIEKPRVPTTEARCAALGGTWKPIGLYPKPVCRMPARDAGRTCGDNDECDGKCLAKMTDELRGAVRRHRVVRTLGVCAPAYPAIGCLAIVEKATVRGILCRD